MRKSRLLIVLLAMISMGCATEKDYLVTIKTKYGDMKVVLFDETPKHKEKFLELAQSGQYDSTIFHRIIPDFMIQGGDINRKGGEPMNDLIDPEFRENLIHTRGMLAAARTGDSVNPEKKSGTQFYIVEGKTYTREELEQMAEDEFMTSCINGLQRLFQQNKYRDLMTELINYQNSGDEENFKKRVMESADIVRNEGMPVIEKTYTDQQYEAYETIGGTPFLDGSYTVYGKVLDGMSVVDSIAVQQRDARDQPLEDIYMTMEVEEVPKAKITKTYGFEYSEYQE